MGHYTVRETSPGINHAEPEKPVYWHWSVEAATTAEAVSIILKAQTGGSDPQVVPRLG
jgi:hypothetical protein